jgi:hypothetical protein
MPWGDRTGPAGMGPRTGRAMGLCSGFNTPGYMNPGPGFGRGRGFGRGFGFRRWAAMPQNAWYPAPAVPAQPMPQPTKDEEIAELKAEKEAIESERKAIAEDLKAIDARLKELEKKNK